MSEIAIYAEGLCSLSVCAPKAMTQDEVAEAVNSQRPTGLDHGWEISGDKTFRNGQPMPCPCEQNPDCQHWLLNC